MQKNKTDSSWESMLLESQRAKLQEKWGPLFEQAVEEAHDIFKRLLKDDKGEHAGGYLTKREFAHALRFMNADESKGRGKQSYDRLIDFMFCAIDLAQEGVVCFYEFVEWMLMMTAGSHEDKLKWGFQLCDMDRDGRVVRTEVTALLTSMFSVLTGLRLDYHNPYVDIFVHDLFEWAATNRTANGDKNEGDWSEERGLTWEEYRAGCLHNSDVLSMMYTPNQSYRLGYYGEHGEKYDGLQKTSKGLAARVGQTVFMGHARADFVLTLMLGLQLAIEPQLVVKAEVRTHEGTSSPIRDAVREAVAKRSLSSQPRRKPERKWSEDMSPSLRRVQLATAGLPSTVHEAAASKPSWPKSEESTESKGSKTTEEEEAEEAAKKEAMKLPVPSHTYQLPPVLYRDDKSWDGCMPSAGGCMPWPSGASQSSITSHGQELFRDIRKAFGVSDEHFLASLGIRQVIGGLLMGDMRGMADRVSEGRSGSMFYYSHDGKFMCKTICDEEHWAMREMLREYHRYVIDHPDTLLMRILGLFELHHARKTHKLIVVANVFNSSLPIHERFDLKGSTYKRTIGRDRRGTSGIVHKDIDFMQMGRSITLPKGLDEELRRQIVLDSAFLERQHVIDYSLLVGVHRRKRIERRSSASGGEKKGELHKWSREHAEELGQLFTELRKSAAEGGGLSLGVLDSLSFDDFVAFAHRSSTSSLIGAGKLRRDNSDKDLLRELSSEIDASSGSLAAAAHRAMERENPQNKGARGHFHKGGHHRHHRHHTRQPLKIVKAVPGTSKFQCVEGGMLGTTHDDTGPDDEVIFVGIIDTLVPYQWRKIVEHWIKSVVQHGQNFSVVPPLEYADRFVKFCTSLVKSRPPSDMMEGPM
eukprot:CAMPEP_0173422004 /NCGR_PEP_ID=MMETSP1357-20121228/2879_1 /TAXON_ID=77926 /ORGANISM="Hemiselmis rufescens, Strain PCC563" /LENGTH=866 /DNA_ID=CAMNT_0014384977 /DNA_START=148 /DNA_END=2748 /DNA_ORIENTATION=-